MVRINRRLKIRQGDESILYKAEKCDLNLDECKDIVCLQRIDSKSFTEKIWQEIYEECYLLSRYRTILLKWDKFNILIENILAKAEYCNQKQEATDLMEQMMLRQGDYLAIEEAGCPILLYKSEGICHNILNVFAEQLGIALAHAGAEIEYYDTRKEDIQGLTKLMGRHFQAIIGMQTYLFSAKMQDGTFLHDYIKGPKFNFIFDHPIWMKNHLTNVPENFYAITHDINYVRFMKKYFQRKSYILPPAGCIVQLENKPEKYDISFIGAYSDYRIELLRMHEMPREIRFIANRFLLELRNHTNFTAEEALLEVYSKKGIQPDKAEFIQMLWEIRRVYYCAMHYFRQLIIKTLLQAGLQVDVFGTTWQESPLKIYPNLVCHPEADYKECIQIWQQSKLSLNIMSWHKGGFTERMANIMLCKTVLVTDDTTYLHDKYVPDEDLIVFHLDDLEMLPGKLKQYLTNESKRHQIAENGWRKACQNETWDSRTKEFLKLCEEL